MGLTGTVIAVCSVTQLALTLVVLLKLSGSRREREPQRPDPDTFAGSQRKRYVELWGSLQKLSFVVEDLWGNVTTQKVSELLGQLRATRQQVEEWSVFFEEEHLHGLRRLFGVIESFRSGKMRLDEVRSKRDLSYVRLDQIRHQMEQNGHYKDEMESLLGSIRRSFREQLASIDKAGVS
jgi:hypothetical protein